MTSPLPKATRERRPWAVTANGLLLVLEGAGFLGAASLYLGPQGLLWPVVTNVWDAAHIALVTGFVFALLAALALFAGIAFFRLAPGAWVIAVLVQGADLFIALTLYFGSRPFYVYAMMLGGLFMVLYLHQADVQIAFSTRRAGPADSQRGTRS
jgi:lysylphosphatidylglycerol synthetase-like protein (DUF2156 family)